jgi:uncharacterized protein YqgC (DUF456 family)
VKPVIYVWATLLTLVNLIWLSLNLLTLPGNWLMVATTMLVAWWQWAAGDPMFSLPTLVAIVALAALGEVVEFFAGVAGATKAGSTRWGSAGALLGGIVGAVAGTFLIPVPVLGSLIGACAGACLGAWGMELLGGRKMRPSIRAGIGGGVGRLAGAALKSFLGVLIWIIVAVAAFWP